MANVNDIEKMKRYIFLEMSEDEFEAVETRFFEDSEYFVDVMTLENDLIDQYAAGLLEGDDLQRFERALEKAPERREKIATARAMQALIAEERPKEAPVAVAPGLWERIANFFTFKSVQMAGAALGIALVALSGILIYQNRQKDQQLARVEEEKRQALAQQEKELLEKIAELERRNQESQDATNELSGELDEVKEQLRKLQQQKPTPEPTVGPQAPVFAFSISSAAGTRGDAPTVRSITTGDGAQLALVTIPLPTEKIYTSYSVTVGGTEVRKGSIAPGRRSIAFLMPARDAEFIVRVSGSVGTDVVGTFNLGAKKLR